METLSDDWERSQTLSDDWSGRSKTIPEVITLIPNFLADVLHFKMAAENTELNTSLFMEEVQKYPAIYSKFSNDKNLVPELFKECCILFYIFQGLKLKLVICNNTKENFSWESEKMNVDFHKNCENTGKILKILLWHIILWNLTIIFSGSHKKFSLVLLQMTTSYDFEKCEKACDID